MGSFHRLSMFSWSRTSFSLARPSCSMLSRTIVQLRVLSRRVCSRWTSCTLHRYDCWLICFQAHLARMWFCCSFQLNCPGCDFKLKALLKQSKHHNTTHLFQLKYCLCHHLIFTLIFCYYPNWHNLIITSFSHFALVIYRIHLSLEHSDICICLFSFPGGRRHSWQSDVHSLWSGSCRSALRKSRSAAEG